MTYQFSTQARSLNKANYLQTLHIVSILIMLETRSVKNKRIEKC